MEGHGANVAASAVVGVHGSYSLSKLSQIDGIITIIVNNVDNSETEAILNIEVSLREGLIEFMSGDFVILILVEMSKGTLNAKGLVAEKNLTEALIAALTINNSLQEAQEHKLLNLTGLELLGTASHLLFSNFSLLLDLFSKLSLTSFTFNFFLSDALLVLKLCLLSGFFTLLLGDLKINLFLLLAFLVLSLRLLSGLLALLSGDF